MSAHPLTPPHPTPRHFRFASSTASATERTGCWTPGPNAKKRRTEGAAATLHRSNRGSSEEAEKVHRGTTEEPQRNRRGTQTKLERELKAGKVTITLKNKNIKQEQRPMTSSLCLSPNYVNVPSEQRERPDSTAKQNIHTHKKKRSLACL